MLGLFKSKKIGANNVTKIETTRVSKPKVNKSVSGPVVKKVTTRAELMGTKTSQATEKKSNEYLRLVGSSVPKVEEKPLSKVTVDANGNPIWEWLDQDYTK